MKKRSISYSEVRAAIQRWAFLSDERMPKSDSESFREVEKQFGFVGKLAMFVSLELAPFDEAEAEAVDSINDVIAFIEKNGVRVTGKRMP